MEPTDPSQKHRILILVNILGLGGAEMQVVYLAREFKARGWEVCVVCMIDPLGWVQQLKQQNIPIHSLHMQHGIPDPRALWRLREIVRSFRPDVVHSHMYQANILGRVARLFCHMPVLICTAHNTRETSRRGGPTWQRELLYRLTDWLADQTTIICNAGWERYVRVGAAPRKKLRMVPNGIDTQLFSFSEECRQQARAALGISSGFTWLAVGRLVKQKDYPTLLKALQLLKRSDFNVLIAGDGPLEQELREECTQRGLEGRVHFCGSTEDMLPMYNAADALVMSSEFEGLSVALLEAASMGLPAVVTEVGGNADVVLDNRTGYLVPPGDPPRLAAALQRMMEASPAERAAMGRAARQHCQANYHLAAVMEKWLDLYAEFLPTVRTTGVSPKVVTATEM